MSTFLSFPCPTSQFADPSTTSESLFSLSSGDDIFNTYNGTPHEPELVWIFSKIYLYIYVALFIYVVANVVIGLIFDTYQKLNVSELHGLGYI